MALLLAFVVRIPWLGGPFSRDESAAMTVAREMTAGELPNVTAWQQRHPGIYLFYGAAALLPVSPDTQLDVLAAAAIAATIVGLAVWLFAIVHPMAATFGLLVYALSSADLATQGHTANTEILINALLVWAVVLVNRFQSSRMLRTLLSAGVLVGMAGSIKEHAVLFLVAMVAVVAYRSGEGWDWRAPSVLIGGAAAPWLLIAAVYAAADELSIVTDTFYFNAHHVRLPLKSLILGPMLTFARGFTPFWGTWPIWVLAAFAVAAAPWLRRPRLIAIAYLVAALGMIILPGYNFPHYYLLALPAAAACGACYLEAIGSRSRTLAGTAAGLVVAYVIALQFLFATGRVPLDVTTLGPTNEETIRQRSFSAELGRRCRGATLLLYGIDHQFHFYSGLRPVQPVLWLDYYDSARFVTPDRGAEAFLKRALDGLEKRTPDLVVLQTQVTSNDRKPVSAYLATMLQAYEPIPFAEIAGRRGAYESIGVTGLYRRGAGDECGRINSLPAEGS